MTRKPIDDVERNWTVAIDVGTSAMKAALFDDEGHCARVLSRSSAPLRSYHDRCEQDMVAVAEVFFTLIRDIASSGSERVSRIALTAQGDGLWPVDGLGQPTRSAMLWSDTRSVDIVEGWRASGALHRALVTTGSMQNAGMPAALLEWLRRNEPDVLRGTHKVLTCGGWLLSQLTGVQGLHESEAAGQWLAPTGNSVIPAVLFDLNMEWAERLIPEILPRDNNTLVLSDRAAAALQLGPDVEVHLANVDLISAAIGSRCVQPGQGFVVFGTALCTGVAQEDISDRLKPGLKVPTFRDLPAYRVLTSYVGTPVLEWAVALLDLESVDDLSLLAIEAPNGADGVTFVPYLAPGGERNPFPDAASGGSMLGLTLRTERSSVARAVLEGMAFVVRDAIERGQLPMESIVVAGGGAASGVWCQIVADVTGLSVSRSSVALAGVRGAFLSALVSDGTLEAHDTSRDQGTVTVEVFSATTPMPDGLEQAYQRFISGRSSTPKLLATPTVA